MKMGKHDLKQLDTDGNIMKGELTKKRRKTPQRVLDVQKRNRKFKKLCKRYGKTPEMVRDRMRPSKQNMTLRQALRKPCGYGRGKPQRLKALSIMPSDKSKPHPRES